MSRLIRLNLMQVFLMCFLVVAMLFIGYEVAEHLWLREANARLQHTLHLLLGLAASVLSATVATYVMVCQFDACTADTTPLTVSPRWRERLQHVSLRTKLIVPMVALAVVPSLGISLLALSELQSLVGGVEGAGSVLAGMRMFFIVATMLVLGVSVMTGAFVAHYVTRPVSVLRTATQAIAGGDLSRRVTIDTRDEIQGLATDFNRMTEQLAEALGRLSRWNAGLQQEVDRRTGELQAMQEGLARVDRLSCIGQMTANIMHEIGNPLAAIKTKIQVAEERDGTSPVLGSVLEEVDRLTGVLRSYSRLSRLQSKPFVSVDLGEVVRGVIVLVAPELRRKGIALEAEVPEALPAIHGDPDRMRQLFINLILNAAEALPQDRVGSVIRVAVLLPGEGKSHVVVEVVDTGVGIPETVLARIWDPFFTTKDHGTGLGLAISKQIVADHNGTIGIESRPQQGTRARVEIPTLVEDTAGAHA